MSKVLPSVHKPWIRSPALAGHEHPNLKGIVGDSSSFCNILFKLSPIHVYLYVPLWVYVHHLCAGAHRSQKEFSNSTAWVPSPGSMWWEKRTNSTKGSLTSTHVPWHGHTFSHTHIHTYIRAYTHTYICTHSHTHIYIHIKTIQSPIWKRLRGNVWYLFFFVNLMTSRIN